jgi:hypothetical protein
MPEINIDFLGETFSPRSKNVDCQRTINYYPEVYKQGSKTLIALIGTPGLKSFTSAGLLVRGAHTFNGVMYIVAGSNLYSVDSSGNLSSVLGTLSTSTGRVSMQDNGIASLGVGGNQLCIADGVGAYVWNEKDQTFTNVSGLVSSTSNLEPISDNTLQLTPSTGTVNFAMVNSVDSNGNPVEEDATYVYSSYSSGQVHYIDFYNFASPTVTGDFSGISDGVTLTGALKAGTSGVGGFALMIGGVSYYSPGFPLTTGFKQYSYQWLYDPSSAVLVGSTLITNGGFTTDTSGWTATGAALASISGGISGNCLQVTNSGAAVGSASQSFATVINDWYQVPCYFEKGTAAGGRIKVGTSSGDNTYFDSGLITNPTWSQFTVQFKATSATTFITLYADDPTSGVTAMYDSVSAYLITPAEWTFAKIDSMQGGVFLDSNGTNYCSQLYMTLDYTSSVSSLGTTGVSQISYIDGYFVGIGTNTMNAFSSNLYDGTIWNALATSPISAAPDTLQSVINSHQMIWFIKQYTSEVFYDAGTPTSEGFPFSRVPNAVIDYGTMAPWSIVRAENTIFFVAQQRLNEGGEFIGIVAINGFSAEVISHQAMNYQISQMGDISGVTAYAYAEGGHTFVVFNFPQITYVFDTTTKMWHERSYYSGSGQYILNRHLGECYCYFQNKHYVSDYRNNGNIYEISSDFLDDDGVLIISMRVAQHLPDKNTLDNVFFSKIQIDMETGV